MVYLLAQTNKMQPDHLRRHDHRVMLSMLLFRKDPLLLFHPKSLTLNGLSVSLLSTKTLHNMQSNQLKVEYLVSTRLYVMITSLTCKLLQITNWHRTSEEESLSLIGKVKLYILKRNLSTTTVVKCLSLWHSTSNKSEVWQIRMEKMGSNIVSS